MSNILAIDTSNSQCSVALNCGGDIKSAFCTQARQHANRLLPMIHELLLENNMALKNLDAVAFVSGPGSFTGLRIGAGVAQGLALGLNLPVLALSTLAVMALKAHAKVALEYYLVKMSAREDEVYFAIYQFKAGDMCLVGKEQVCAPAHCLIPDDLPLNSCCAVGDGWQAEKLEPNVEPFISHFLYDCEADAVSLSCLAQTRFAAGGASAPELALPVYLKDQMDY